MKSRQQEDLRAKITGNSLYRIFSVPLTYIFIRLGISANTITLSTFFLSIFGLIFLSIGSYYFLIVGTIFFGLFILFDHSDGEVARIQKKENIEGIYFDRVSHYISSVCFGAGLGYGLYRLYNDEIYIILGIILALIFVVEYSVGFVLYYSIRGEIINRKLYKTKDSIKKIQKQMWRYIYKGSSWSDCNFFSKIFGVYPFQGLVYSSFFIPPILLFLVIIEFFIQINFNFPFLFYGHKIGVISIYLFLISISKLIWIIGFIYLMEKNRYITNFLNKISK